MDLFIFLTIMTFQISIIAIVAIVYGQSNLADKAITGLHSIVKSIIPSAKPKQTKKQNTKSIKRTKSQSRPVATKPDAPPNVKASNSPPKPQTKRNRVISS